MSNSQGLTRSSNRFIAGVCGGIAEFLGWSPTVVRILYVLLSIISAAFPGILAYLILWVVMPNATTKQRLSNQPVA